MSYVGYVGCVRFFINSHHPQSPVVQYGSLPENRELWNAVGLRRG
jgi:hypothetical protein